MSLMSVSHADENSLGPHAVIAAATQEVLAESIEAKKYFDQTPEKLYIRANELLVDVIDFYGFGYAFDSCK